MVDGWKISKSFQSFFAYKPTECLLCVRHRASPEAKMNKTNISVKLAF